MAVVVRPGTATAAEGGVPSRNRALLAVVAATAATRRTAVSGVDRALAAECAGTATRAVGAGSPRRARAAVGVVVVEFRRVGAGWGVDR